MWPTSAPTDREGCRFEDGQVKVPEAIRALFCEYMDAGWMVLTADERYGGAGMPTTLGLAFAGPLVGANLAFSTYPGLTRGVARVLERFGSEWLRETFVPRLFCGEWTGTMCLTEPHAGYAVGDLRAAVVKDGDRYRIRGNKFFITGGDHDLAENIVHLLLARVEGAPRGIKGVSLFCVPKRRVNEDGSLGEPNDVVCTGIEEKLGLEGSATCSLAFGENDACYGYLLGEENRGIEYMFQLMNEARIGTGLHGLAAASVAYQVARATRRTFLSSSSGLSEGRHRASSTSSRNGRTTEATCLASSISGRCPRSSKTWKRAPGMPRARRSA